MSSTCIEKVKCPDCSNPNNLHIQPYLTIDDDLGMEWYTSFCHGECWEAKGDLYTGGKAPEVHVKTEEEIKAEVATIKSCPIFKLRKNYRGIPIGFYRSWGCRTLYSEFDGKTPYAIGFPYSLYAKLCGWKCRPLRKKDFYGIGKTSDVDPFGLERAFQLGGDTLWITEGEFDAIALDYCMTLVGKKSMYPVISLTHGGGSLAKNMELIVGRLHSFGIKQLVFVLDDDEVGHIAEEMAPSYWDDVVIVNKPKGCKDANDAVKLGFEEEMGRLALLR